MDRGRAAITLPFLLALLVVRLAGAQAPGQPTPAEIIQRLHEQTAPRAVVPFDPKQFDKYAGYYQLEPTSFFTSSVPEINTSHSFLDRGPSSGFRKAPANSLQPPKRLRSAS